jgi:hypothetical protein
MLSKNLGKILALGQAFVLQHTERHLEIDNMEKIAEIRKGKIAVLVIHSRIIEARN